MESINNLKAKRKAFDLGNIKCYNFPLPHIK